MSDKPSASFVFVVPSLLVSGGNLEIVKLARDLQHRHHDVRIVSMWRAEHPVDTAGIPVDHLSDTPFSRWPALRQMPLILAVFARRMRERRRPGLRVVFSHYSTYPLAAVVARRQRWFFVQDTEWNFVRAGRYRSAVKRFILACLRSGKVLTANPYLAGAMRDNGVAVAAEIDIWADVAFAGDATLEREYDLVMVLRTGANKRSDLSRALILRCHATRPHLRLALITPDGEFCDEFGARVAACALRPDQAAMRCIYERSRLFVLLSEHEGFGLPPLEAMGSGCVPLCRDAGGVRSYMVEDLAGNLLPLNASLDEILERAEALIVDRAGWQHLSAASLRIFGRGISAFERRLESAGARAFIAD